MGSRATILCRRIQVLLCAAAFGLGAMTARAAAPQTGREKWRSLAKLPTVSLEWRFEATSDQGFVLGGDKLAWPDEIAALEKQIQREPSDPELYYRLSRLRLWVGDRDKARQSLDKAVALLRQRLEAQPANGLVHARLGRALSARGDDLEAEAELRRAVVIAPEDWRVWLELSGFLEGEAVGTLFSTNGPASLPELLHDYTGSARPRRIAADRIERARRFISEAERGFDETVALAPEQAEAWFRHGMARGPQRLIDLLADWNGEREEAATALATFMYRLEAVPDLRKAASLSPRDYRLIGGAALYELWAYAVQAGKGGLHSFMESQDWWRGLPETNRASTLAAASRLEDLSRDASPKVAAGALEMLAVIQFLAFHNLPASEASVRRAVALDSSREAAWELWMAMLVTRERFAELLPAAEARLKAKNTVRNRILVAKAHERLGRWEQAEQQVDAALKLAPDSVLAHLAKASLLLRRSADASSLVRADQHLRKAEQALGESPNRDEAVALLLRRSLYFALNGDTATARKVVEKMLEADADNQDAKEILQSLPR